MNGCNQKQLLPLAVPSHPLYRIRRNYDDKWDTIEYRSSNDQYICSVEKSTIFVCTLIYHSYHFQMWASISFYYDLMISRGGPPLKYVTGWFSEGGPPIFVLWVDDLANFSITLLHQLRGPTSEDNFFGSHGIYTYLPTNKPHIPT